MTTRLQAVQTSLNVNGRPSTRRITYLRAVKRSFNAPRVAWRDCAGSGRGPLPVDPHASSAPCAREPLEPTLITDQHDPPADRDQQVRVRCNERSFPYRFCKERTVHYI